MMGFPSLMGMHMSGFCWGFFPLQNLPPVYRIYFFIFVVDLRERLHCMAGSWITD